MRLFSKIENSKDITDKEYVDGLVVKSINGLAGGTLTSPITLTGGDGANASKMILTSNGQITDSGTATMLGFSSGNYIVGSANYPTTFRGKQTRPTWNGKDLALKSDVPTVPTNYVTADTRQTITGNKTFTTTSSGGPQIGIYNGQMSVVGETGNDGNIIWNTPDDAIAANFSVNESGAHLYLGVDAAADIRLNEDAGTSGQVLTSQGAGITPKWTTPSTPNNGTLTIQKNGSNVQTFSANQSTNTTANITVPETFDDLTRIKKQGYAGANNAVQYFKLATFPEYNNSGNYASLIITGRMGGWEAGNMSFVNMIVYNRGAEGGGYVSVDNGNFSSLCDIVMYRETNNSSTVYLKVSGYYTFDININTFQSVYAYTGSNVTPTGTLKWTASSQADRLVVSDSVAYVNGHTLPKTVKINGNSANPNASGLVDLGTNFAKTDAENTFTKDQYIGTGAWIGAPNGFVCIDNTTEDYPALIVSDGGRIIVDNGAGTAGQVLTSSGSFSAPTWTTPPQFTLSGTTLTITV